MRLDRPVRRALPAALLTLALFAAGCGDDDVAGEDGAAASTTTVDSAVTTTSPAETTTTAAPEPVSYTEPGPYAVGVRTLSLGDRDMEVWYPVDPAAVEGEPTEIFDTLSVFPESLRPLIPAELSGEVDTGAHRDAPPSTEVGPAGVVVYSHGFGGYRQVATNYTVHLASYGYVVVSVDHLERGIAAQATGNLGGAPNQDVTDVENALAALAADADLGPVADLDRVVITGHSAGAGTSARAANLDAIDGFVSISGGPPVSAVTGETGVRFVTTEGVPNGTYSLEITAVTDADVTVLADGTETTVPQTAAIVPLAGGTATLVSADGTPFAPGTIEVTVAFADKPALVLIAEKDLVVLPDRSRSLYRELANDKWLVDIADAGHNSFTDSCAGILAQGGLQSLVPLIGEAQVARAEDGCTAAYADPVAVQQLTAHYTVAFVVHVLDGGDTASLGPEAVDFVPGLTLADHQAG